MAWTSTEDIKMEMQLKSSSDDFAGLKRELRLKLAELHPDKNGGAFISTEDEEQFNKVAAAYDFVNLASQESKSLVPITQLPAIIKAVREAQTAPVQSQISHLRTECREESRFNSHRRYALPRIGSGVFAAVCASLFTFSSSLAQHPVLGFIAKSNIFQYTLLALAAYAGLFFLLTWVRERKEEALIDFLMSEEGRRRVFDRIFDHTRQRTFSIRNVMDIIQEHFGSRHYYSWIGSIATVFFARPNIQSSLAEKIAQMHLLELEKRGAIHRVEIPSMDSLYEFDEHLERN